MNIKPRPATSVRVALRRGLVQGVTCCALLAAPVVGASMMPIPMDYAPSPGHSQTTVSRVERMVESGRCWIGEAPAEMQGVVPGHVWANGTYRGERAVGLALEQIFEGKDHGLRVQAFCR